MGDGAHLEVLELSSPVMTQSNVSLADLEQAYAAIAARLDARSPAQLRQTWLLLNVGLEAPVDAAMRPNRWNPLLSYSLGSGRLLPREMLASWLVLAFPEIRVLALAENDNELAAPWCDHLLRPDSSHQPQRSSVATLLAVQRGLDSPSARSNWFTPPLFDLSGLRNLVKQVAFAHEGLPLSALPADRRQCAAAIDEETEYAFFNALTAYRFGYRVAAVISAQAMKEVFREGSSSALAGTGRWRLVFEDVYLNFVDREAVFDRGTSGGEFHLSDFEVRDRECPGLKQSDRRILVTAGHARGKEADARWRASLVYLRSVGIRCDVVIKPIADMWRLWRAAGQWDRFAVRPRTAEGFTWPPRPDEDSQQRWEIPHSAPGRLLRIAETLLSRSRRVLAGSEGVEAAAHAAVLALEAKELLAGRTPTTALEAIAVQHECEVTAESLFVGVEYNLDVKDRFAEIDREVSVVSRWFARRQRTRSALNARLAIIERVAKRFRDLNQIEEEMACLSEARKLRFEFWVRERPWRWVFWPILRYVAFALSSLGRFALGVGSWVIFFAGVHYLLHTIPDTRSATGFPHALMSSAYFFATLQPCQAMAHSTLIDGLLAVQGLFAFLNFGLLISHLYLMVSRR